MTLVSLVKGKGPNGFGYDTTAEEVTANLDLSQKTLLVTGCNSGLGFETLRVLALRGARVIGTARTLEKAEQACSRVSGQTLPLACDLSSKRSVFAALESVRKEAVKLDALICNAGVMALPKLERAYGYELQFFTNHIGHFMLVTNLLEQLSERGRVVVLSSDAHRAAPRSGIQFDNLSGEKGYRPWREYGQSKLANLLFAKELANRLPGKSQTANAVHPGVIVTNLQRSMPRWMRSAMTLGESLFLKSIPQGAATQVYVAVHPSATESGQYFADCQVRSPRKKANDRELAQRLWQESEKIVAQLPD